jgi:hypothetical protein
MTFKSSPTLRFWVRTLVVAALGYVTTTLTAGIADGFDWQKFALGLLGTLAGAAYAVIGASTPVEPFVGIQTEVEVPVPPAEPHTAT